MFSDDKPVKWNSRRRISRKNSNRVSKKGIYLHESLPETEAKNEAAAKQMGLEIITNNCMVLVAARTDDKGKIYVKVNSVDDLKAPEKNAVQRKYVQMRERMINCTNRIFPNKKT